MRFLKLLLAYIIVLVVLGAMAGGIMLVVVMNWEIALNIATLAAGIWIVSWAFHTVAQHTKGP